MAVLLTVAWMPPTGMLLRQGPAAREGQQVRRGTVGVKQTFRQSGSDRRATPWIAAGRVHGVLLDRQHA